MLWAQIGRSIPPFGIYHIENFYGEIPCTERNPQPISGDYSEYLKNSIVEAFGNKRIEQVPAILLYGFGAVTFADSVEKAIALARCLKTVAMTAWNQMALHKVQYIDYSMPGFPERESHTWSNWTWRRDVTRRKTECFGRSLSGCGL